MLKKSMTDEFRLRCGEEELPEYARRYPYHQSDMLLLDLQEHVRKQGCLTLEQLEKAARWKSPRRAAAVRRNAEEFVRDATGIALSSHNERVRIEVLTLLDGVSWPTASVILHFFHNEQYPIIDTRALWSVSMEGPARYTFNLWWAYVNYCRKIAQRTGLDMRTLDRALWQYSKENQRSGIQANRTSR